MGHITVDDALLARLGQLREPVEVRDKDGRLRGYFQPFHTPEEVELYERVKGLVDMDRIRATLERERGQGRPFKEVIAELRAREQRG